MNKRPFGKTDLRVSEIGFGAWAIGGPVKAGNMPIGWGEVDDTESERALRESINQGINFIDTADFYGFGHSEKLIGKIIGNRSDMIIATKVGHRLGADGSILFDYSKDYIVKACDASLKRLNRDAIDYYQLHTAKVSHLEAGDCLEALEILQQSGKIRYWGISLNTYDPFPEADYLFRHSLGSGFQLVFNIINQKAYEIVEQAAARGYGVISRMPLQFGLLTGKFNENTRFSEDDHRHFRLKPGVLQRSLQELKPLWKLADKYGVSPAKLSLSYILNVPHISTVIPGIRTAQQARENATGLATLEKSDFEMLHRLYDDKLKALLAYIQREESS